MLKIKIIISLRQFLYQTGKGSMKEEWKNLRSIERRKLLGKPLQLPLAVELCYLSESNNHNNKVSVVKLNCF